MQKLFVYGTLKDPKVQLELLGRVAGSTPDSLIGFETSQVEIEGETYPILIEKADSEVSGEVLEVTEAELEKIDEHETSAYRRVSQILKSGTEAWVYIK